MSSELDRKFSSLRPVFKDLVIKKAALKWNTTVCKNLETKDINNMKYEIHSNKASNQSKQRRCIHKKQNMQPQKKCWKQKQKNNIILFDER